MTLAGDLLASTDNFFLVHPGVFLALICVIGLALAWWFGGVIVASVAAKEREREDLRRRVEGQRYD